MSRVTELLEELKEILSEGEVPEDTDVNRILDQDRSPAHSDTPPGMITTEYGINNKIKIHANRQRFGALRRVQSR